jgi:hypothetical protein
MVTRKKMIFGFVLVSFFCPVAGLYAMYNSADAITARQAALAAERAMQVLSCLPVQDLADLVAAYAASTDAEIMQANKKLMDSGRSGDVAAAIQALDAGADIDYADIFCNAMMATGSTTLCEAAYHGHIALVQELIARGAQFPIDTAHNQNPLCDAASKGHIDVVKLLIKSKVGVNLPALCNNNRTPLWEAINGRHTAIAQMLVKAGAHSDADVKKWKEALMWNKKSLGKDDGYVEFGKRKERYIKTLQHILTVIEQTKRNLDKQKKESRRRKHK